MPNYILVNIGCIECGVSSNIVGRFSSEEAADALCAKLQKSHYWREHGQNQFDVFPEPQIDEIGDEYK